MYDVDGKLLNVNKSMYVKSLACLRVKGGESECFRINSGVRHNVYMDVGMKEVKMGMGRREVRF